MNKTICSFVMAAVVLLPSVVFAQNRTLVNAKDSTTAAPVDVSAICDANNKCSMAVTLSTGGAGTEAGTTSNPLSTSSTAKSSSKTTEVLVATTATATPTTPLAGRKSLEIQNIGPYPIYCRCDGTAPVVKKARKIATDTSWALDCDGTACACQCIAETANQVTTAATIVTELK